MKAVRIALTILVVLGALFLAFRGYVGRGRAKPPDLPPAPAGKSGPDPWSSPFAPLSGQAAPPSPPAKPLPPAAVEPIAVDPAPGTPVKPGADVSLAVTPIAGTKSKYRVKEAQLSRDRETSDTQWYHVIWNVTTEVMSVDPSGTARIKFQIDAFRLQTEAATGPVDFDSERPDETLLAKPEFARGFKPLLAILGVPVEFTVDAGNAIRDVQGVDALRRKYVEALDPFGAKAVAEAVQAPTAENMIETWSEALFPPIGGGTMKAPASRAVVFQKTDTQLERWSAVTRGPLRVTHEDPGSFRVEFKGKPEIVELNRPAKTEMALAVEKARIVASDESTVGAWRFDRTKGRLVFATVAAKYRYDISRRAGKDENGNLVYEPKFTDVERQISVELLDT
jgi:hypothetical protein